MRKQRLFSNILVSVTVAVNLLETFIHFLHPKLIPVATFFQVPELPLLSGKQLSLEVIADACQASAIADAT